MAGTDLSAQPHSVTRGAQGRGRTGGTQRSHGTHSGRRRAERGEQLDGGGVAHTRVAALAHTHTHTLTHTLSHAHTHTHTALAHTHSHTHTHTHTRTHTHTHNTELTHTGLHVLLASLTCASLTEQSAWRPLSGSWRILAASDRSSIVLASLLASPSLVV